VKFLLLRSNELRHQALAARLSANHLLAADFIEDIRPASSQSNLSSLEKSHFRARSQVESDFFFQSTLSPSQIQSQRIPAAGINSPDFHSQVDKLDFDVAITFGVSILSSETISKLRNRILGIHLGLSPYYRGSGTNFFPFVNKELGAVGYTLMHLDSGVDTGAVVHQGRAPVVLGDSIHSIGNRNIECLIRDIVRLGLDGFDLNSASEVNHSNGKIYRKRDFTEEVLKTALHNLSNGLVDSYINNMEKENDKFPLVQNSQLE
jgi:hypothetical protein